MGNNFFVTEESTDTIKAGSNVWQISTRGSVILEGGDIFYEVMVHTNGHYPHQGESTSNALVTVIKSETRNANRRMHRQVLRTLMFGCWPNYYEGYMHWHDVSTIANTYLHKVRNDSQLWKNAGYTQ